MTTYIDAEKLIAEIERRIDLICTTEGVVQRDKLQEYETLRDVEDFVTSLQQEQPKGINGVVHHTMCVHWVVPNQKQLDTALKEFPEGSEVELFIVARKEE